MVEISTSILSVKKGEESSTFFELEAGKTDYFHIDVMDGTFVPEITIGAGVVKAISPVTDAVFDVHLMVEHPETQIDSFVKAGADIITFHLEAAKHPHRIIQAIHAAGCKAGISINPGTPLCMLEELLAEVDLVLLMSVNPGYGGQKFIPSVLDKVGRLKAAMLATDCKAELEVDGGVTLENAQQIIDMGADVLVAGSAVYGAEDVEAAIKGLHGNV